MSTTREFDNILNECLERILVRGDTIEQCLGSYPEQATELRSLLETALTTKQATAITPRLEFRERARYQFQAALREAEQKRAPRSFFSWQPRWATVVATALAVFLLGGGGTVAAASNSLPDEPLYPVKLASEQVRLALTPSPIGKADLYLKLTDERVAEITAMAERGRTKHVEEATERLNEHLVAVVALTAPQGAMPVGIMMAPSTQMATSQEALAEPPLAAPPASEITMPEARQAPVKGMVVPAATPAPLRLGNASDNRTSSKEFTRLDKEARVKIIIARRAAENAEALHKALEHAPESCKPALRRAIALSEEGYRQALRSLEDD